VPGNIDVAEFSREDAEAQLRDAEMFVEKIAQLLGGSGAKTA
jgi:hypothetical protein